jgi:carnitine-CoA ligase
VIDLGNDDAMLTAQAFSYLDPQWALVLTLTGGARLVVLERFRPTQIFDKLVTHGITFFYCLAAMPLMLLACPPTPQERAHRLRVVMCSAIPAERHAELEERFGVPWLEAYGSTEAGFSIGVSWANHASTRGSGTIGRPLPHYEAAIVDDEFASVEDGTVGELLIRGPGMMQGYWRNPSATAEAFHKLWYCTGDLARRDADGLYYLAGRRKDMIRRAGENIAAAEVENVLQQHPAVVIAACVPVPDPVRNEEVRVFLVTRGEVSVPDLVAFLDPRLAPFKIPRYWTFVERLPMTASERVAKPLLPHTLDASTIDRSMLPHLQDPAARGDL